tara:strand:+ start:540 stop:752 length:213 start_codon:yes stop_codon:yes gene_type:complete
MLRFCSKDEGMMNHLMFNSCDSGLFLELAYNEQSSDLDRQNIIIKDIPSLIQLRNEIDFAIASLKEDSNE